MSYNSPSGAAIRSSGVCRGFLWKSVDNVKVYEYCILLGITLTCYTDPLAYFRGDYPTTIYKLVGASSSATQDALQFRMVTFQGTHVYCTSPTKADSSVWLAALQAGLEASMMDELATPPRILIPPPPERSPKKTSTSWRSSDKKTTCNSCGRRLEIVDRATPLVQYGMESRAVACPECCVAQGVVMDISTLSLLYTTFSYEHDAMAKARAVLEDDPANVLTLLRTHPTLVSLRRTSQVLDRKCTLLETGRMDVLEFLETTSAASSDSNSIGELKKQAFRVAGDIGSALKLLHELTSKVGSEDMLRHVLDFFLDLCEEGELNAVAFFWPQLRAIHLSLMPASTFEELCKLELMEDFMLTIATKYSIQLAMELVWGCVADLQDAMSRESTRMECRRRRFSVLRFVCELESLLFDFADGWGGGSVSLRNMLTPSPHQVALLKEEMTQLQMARKKGSFHLSRSTRMDKILHNKFQKPPDVAAQDALRAAKNADYFSTHLSFTRRLCDVAEKLRFLEVDERKPTLERELTLLNSSGSMGGDPLNRLTVQLVRVVRIPTTEGHVFRSKERTPVLLLMEVVEEGHDNFLGLLTEEEKSEYKAKRAKENAQFRRTAMSHELDAELPPGEESGDYEYDFHHTSVSDYEHPSDPSLAVELNFERSGLPHSPSGALGKFKRYDSANGEVAKTPDRTAMEKLVNSVLNDQLVLPDIGLSEMVEQDTEEETKNDGVQEDTGDEAKANEAQEEPTDTKGSSLDPSSRNPSSSKLNLALATRMSALGENPLANDDIRRDVLTTIMAKGMRGSNAIAAGAAVAAQKSLQELDRRRAVNLILNADDATSNDYSPPTFGEKEDFESARKKQSLQLNIGDAFSTSVDIESPAPPSEEDEAMEALRLLLIQNQVAHGELSEEEAMKVYAMRMPTIRNINSPIGASVDPMDRSEFIEIDAGDVDDRLKGCGPLPPAVLSALTLWKGGVITNGELLELVKKDIQFIQQVELSEAKLREDSAFWGRFAFGERWAEKKARINATSPVGSTPGWDLQGVIVKSNDDLRQEAFVMQLIELCHEAFVLAGLDLWISPYRILATGRTTGIIEMVRNAMSFDALKKRPGYGKGGLRMHLMRMTEFSPNPEEAFQAAQHNFVRSLAAYSVMSYLFLFKDRHNGNLLMDTAGHVIHIDFGFVFGIAPGGSFSLESTPFKLTEEMLEVMGGMQSSCFSEFVTLFCCGFLTLQAHMDTFLTIVEITCDGSSFKCFEGRTKDEILGKMRDRFCPHLGKEASVAFALDLIKQATRSYGTKQYDYYQYLAQGIAA